MSTRQAISKLVYSKARKPVIWLGASRAAVQEFPRPARKAAGHALLAVQCGLSPPDTKTMSSIGPGVAEIRVHVGGEFRVIYVAKHVEAVYVLHAFEKRTQRTRQGELELARTRLRAAERSRPAQGEPLGRHHRGPIKR